MSDPMTNSEVEDVLSSIRRLVSDESRPEPTVVEPSKPVSDRLVLTPSLRVPEDDVPKDDVPEDDILDENLADEIEQQAEDPTVSEQIGSERDHFDFKSARSIFDLGAPGEDRALFRDDLDTAVEISDDVDLEDDVDLDEQASVVAQEEVVDIALENGPETIDPVEDVSEANEYISENPEGIDLVEKGLEQADRFDNDLEVAQLGDTVSEGKEHSPVTLGEKIAALETLIAGRADEWEPDQAGAGAYAGTEPPAMAWEDAGEPETDCEEETACGENETVYDEVPEPVDFNTHAEADPVLPENEVSSISLDESVIDEDVLRELVSDIVREELQGALGERITRNVRKLVRREIHRALVAKELE